MNTSATHDEYGGLTREESARRMKMMTIARHQAIRQAYAVMRADVVKQMAPKTELKTFRIIDGRVVNAAGITLPFISMQHKEG